MKWSFFLNTSSHYGLAPHISKGFLVKSLIEEHSSEVIHPNNNNNNNNKITILHYTPKYWSHIDGFPKTNFKALLLSVSSVKETLILQSLLDNNVSKFFYSTLFGWLVHMVLKVTHIMCMKVWCMPKAKCIIVGNECGWRKLCHTQLLRLLVEKKPWGWLGGLLYIDSLLRASSPTTPKIWGLLLVFITCKIEC